MNYLLLGKDCIKFTALSDSGDTANRHIGRLVVIANLGSTIDKYTTSSPVYRAHQLSLSCYTTISSHPGIVKRSSNIPSTIHLLLDIKTNPIKFALRSAAVARVESRRIRLYSYYAGLT